VDDRRALPIRVLLIDMPQMLREIIRRRLARDGRFEIVGEYTKHVSIEFAVDRSRADYVIVGEDVFESASMRRRVLEEGPQVRMLAVRADGGRATLHQLRPEEVDLGELSPERLVKLMAEAPRPGVVAGAAG
jgi:DNA-binding NarL/FixJ family response regulator